jgi:hypothetical protein
VPERRALEVRRAHCAEADPTAAIAALRRELAADEADAVLLFVSPQYDMARLGAAIQAGFEVPVAACTTAGQIGPGGYLEGGITGVSLGGGRLRMRLELIHPLTDATTQAAQIAAAHAARRAPGTGSFGVLFVDGESECEEYVVASLYESLGNVPLVGGTAGSVDAQVPTSVYFDGRFRQGIGVLALFETQDLEVATFAVQHLRPSQNRLVITLSDSETRRVYEINGEPAARAYARALGKTVDSLTQVDFACTPLLLNLGDRHFPRAIRSIGPDGSLLLACAVDEGLVVSIAAGGDPLAELESTLGALAVKRPELLLVFDCVLRRIELHARGLSDRVGALLNEHRAVGFNSYGEQLGPLHLNHNLTGLALGPSVPGGRS